MSSEPSEPREISTHAFAYRPFVLYWAARFLNALSTQMVSVAVGWQLYDETRDPFLLGLVGLVQFLPALLLVLVTGAAADRFSRRRIMGLCMAAESLCVVALAGVWAYRAASPGIEHPVWPIFLVLTVFGVARAFLGPAVQSLAANLVPREAFANAVAWNSSSWQVALIVGPVLGGLLYGLSSFLPYAAALTLFLVGSVLTQLIPKPAQHSQTGGTSMQTLLAGVGFIAKNPLVFGAISLDMVAVMLGGATALLPAVARDVLHAGPMELGFLRAAPGVGAVAMALYLMRRPIADRAGVVLFVAVAIFGAAVTLFGLTASVVAAVLLLALMGAADMVSVYVRQTLVQLATPDDVRGRVSAVNTVFIGASNELGEFRAGTMASLIGVGPAIVFGGIGTIVVAGLWSRMFPALLNVRKLSAHEAKR